MNKKIRIVFGGILAAIGVVFFIVPGSMLLLLLGLMLLSYDIPKARQWLGVCQKAMSKSARKLDKKILDRKLKI